ncbi:MAG: ABC transporter substrate-binding protein [Pelosinus sp.]|nr:ABC transporter substrate-binding protein [Pelosinus sp.]
MCKIRILTMVWCIISIFVSASAMESNTVKIGGNIEMSGYNGSFGYDVLSGARLAVKEVNDSGGVLGRQVEFVVRDNASNAVESGNVMTALVSQDNIVAAVGPLTSSNSLSAALIAEDCRIPIITPTATNPKVTMEGNQVRRYVFREAFVDPYQGKIMSDFALGSLRAKTAAVIIDNSSDYSKSVALLFENYFTGNGGRIVLRDVYLPRDQDFSQQLARIQSVNADIIFIPGYYEEVGYIIRQAREMGITIPVLGTDSWDSPKLVKYAGITALNNTFFSNHYSPQERSLQNQRFVTAYQKEYTSDPNAMSALGYDALMLLVEAIKKVNSDDPEKIRDALESLHTEGVSGRISFNGLHNPIKSGVVIEMVDGKQTFLQRVDP